MSSRSRHPQNLIFLAFERQMKSNFTECAAFWWGKALQSPISNLHIKFWRCANTNALPTKLAAWKRFEIDYAMCLACISSPFPVVGLGIGINMRYYHYHSPTRARRDKFIYSNYNLFIYFYSIKNNHNFWHFKYWKL